MFHLGAFRGTSVASPGLQTIAAVREEMFFTAGADFRVPVGLSSLIGAACLINAATGLRAQLQSPSLRVLANLDIEPLVNALVFGTPPEQAFHPDSPNPLTPDEALNFAIVETAGAIVAHGLIFLADGPQQPVTGNIFTVQATGASALAAGLWVNSNLTFAQVLPAGGYQVVGMRARGANLVAARLVFPEQVARPGVLAVNAIGDLDPWTARYGRTGVFGEFPHTNPPTIDCLGTVDAAQTVLLDLIKVR